MVNILLYQEAVPTLRLEWGQLLNLEKWAQNGYRGMYTLVATIVLGYRLLYYLLHGSNSIETQEVIKK